MNRRAGLVAVCVIGDSFVLGTGATEGGWVSRLAESEPQLTIYNLGVRRDTGMDIAARWRSEVAARTGRPQDTPCLLSWGANDADPVNREAFALCEEVTGLVLDGLTRDGHPCAFVGPPSVPWPDHDLRVAQVSARLRRVCNGRGVPYLSLHAGLPAEYRDALASRGDAHPTAEGYEQIWSLVYPFWKSVKSAWTVPMGS